jgi:hypothetical protein
MPPTLVEVPKIERPGRKTGSKYVRDEDVEQASILCSQGWCGDLIEPVDTLVKARIAANAWKSKLSEHMKKDRDAFAVRVFTPVDTKGKPQTGKFTFAIALKKGA